MTASRLLLCMSLIVGFREASAQNFVLVLRVDQEEVYADEPLVFSTSISNPLAQKNHAWNQEVDRELARLAVAFQEKKIDEEAYGKETERLKKGRKETRVMTVGTKEMPWYKMVNFRVYTADSAMVTGWPIEVLGRSYSDSVAVMDERGYYLVKHHVPIEGMAKLRPGEYRVSVGLDSVVSKEIRVKVLGQKMPAEVKNRKETMLRLGKYYVQALEGDAALEYAERVLKKEPGDLGGLILRGEALVVKGMYGEALTAFEGALEIYRRTWADEEEPPDYILGMIEWLRERP